MDRLKEIDQEIARLKEEHAKVLGTETEVYARVVGYYRNPKNFNIGKAAEYKERLMFDISNI